MTYTLPTIYATTAHPVRGTPEIKPIGRRRDERTAIKTRSTRNVWELAKGRGYELHDKIELMTRNEARRQKRKKK